MKTQNEIIKQGYDALINSLGITDTIRFIQYFSPGKGDYTKERHQWLDEKTLTEVLAEIQQLEKEDTNQYEEIIE
ncbi:hypothetical protein A0J48_015805 [Sphaerospermopsis aphanizomenoides BCCUSP55]|nr:hypothetical protein [Sphaerospermopsis aphanizomenoides]MBK1988985.1 hypothetical protein [Sphaerospermopsis aphanizomenoides BCCUSP55]